MQSDIKKDDMFIQRAFVGDDDEEPKPGIVCYHAPGNTEVKKVHVPVIMAPSQSQTTSEQHHELNKSKTSFKTVSEKKSKMKSLKTLQSDKLDGLRSGDSKRNSKATKPDTSKSN